MAENRLQLDSAEKDMLIEFRRELHAHPELSMEEYETTERIKRELNRHGIEILNYPLKTGVLAVIRGQNPGKTIALRADIDALPVQECSDVPFLSQNPGIMHACGHDFHVTNVLGAGILLQAQRERLKGNVLLVFQPAEEALHGSKTICATGVFEDMHVESILGMHVTPGFKVGEVGIRYGQFMASPATVCIEVIGKSGHSAHPQDSIDPVLPAAHIITALQSFVSREISPIDSAVISICEITAGSAPNIIPDRVMLKGSIRTLSNEMFDRVSKAVERISTNVAHAFRAEAKTSLIRGALPLICNDEAVAALEESLIKTIGNKNIIRIGEPTMGSEDFSEYSLHTKVVYCRIGARGADERSAKVLHSSGIALDENVIEVAVNVLANYCVDLLK